MPNSKKHSRAKNFLGRHRGTVMALFICVLLSIIFYLSYLATDPTHIHLRELFFHISLALIVAFILTIVVDYNLSLRHHEELAADVFSAVLHKLVPAPLADELQTILRGEVIREGLRYTLTFNKPYSGIGDDYFILQREITYELKNVVNHRVIFPIESYLELENGSFEVQEQGESFEVPRHRKFKIDGVEIDLVAGQNVLHEKNYKALSHTIRIRRGQSAKVYLCSEEVMRVIGGKNSYIQIHPTVGLEVIVKNQYRERIEIREVLLNHPNWSDFAPQDDESYRFEGGILPGQGFQIGWVPR